MPRLSVPDEPTALHLDFTGWSRRGGQRITVHVTADQLATAVHNSLPTDWGPWHTTGADRRPTGPQGRAQEHPWAADDVDFSRAATAPDGHERLAMYLWSPRLTQTHPPLAI